VRNHAVSLASAMPPATVHVDYAYVEPMASAYGEVAAYFPRAELLAYEKQSGQAVLDAAAARLTQAGLPFTTEMRLGPVAEMIVKRAQEVACDGIVMGTHGRSAIRNLIMGSVASRVVHLARVPVTLVK
jgi:nucleotide-binding universal stress UspA family protein